MTMVAAATVVVIGAAVAMVMMVMKGQALLPFAGPAGPATGSLNAKKARWHCSPRVNRVIRPVNLCKTWVNRVIRGLKEKIS